MLGAGWDQQAATEAIQAMLQGGATGGDREGSRVTYGSYISMMGLIDKAFVAPGEFIIKEGDDAAFFFALLSGEVEVSHKGKPVAVLRASWSHLGTGRSADTTRWLCLAQGEPKAPRAAPVQG